MHKKIQQRLISDGTVMNLGLTAVIFASFFYNPEIWIDDAPPDIREKFGPKSEKAKRQSIFVAIPFFLILIGGVFRSNYLLKQQNGGRLPFKMAFWNVYGLFLYFWLYDLVILDWLIFVTLKPKIFIWPGTEGMAGYDDYGFHLKAALPFVPLVALPSLLIAALTASKS